jgi:hypothetical protein
MDYQLLNTTATALIKRAGFPIVVSRDGATVGKGHGVFSPSKKQAEQGATSATPLSIASKTMYATAVGKFDPQVGDLISGGKLGRWQVVAVEDYKPSTLTVAFRIEVQ